MPNWKKLIVSGSDANLSSLTIDGSLTASSAYLESASIGHLQTIYETASVIYSSGSTKFGDTLDDTHEITGSLLVTGSITGDLTGTASYATTSSHALNVPDTASHALTAVSSSFTATGDGVFSGSFSGSFIGDASNLNVNPFPFTGSGEMQGKLIVESFQDYLDEEYVESYFAGTAIAASGDIALTGSIFSAYINGNTFTGSLLGTSSYAETASYYGGSIESASFAESSSISNFATTSSHTSGTASIADFATTSSHSLTSTTSSHTAGTASISDFATTSSHTAGTASISDFATTASHTAGTSSIADFATSASFIETSQTASYVLLAESSSITSQAQNNNTASGSLSFWQGSQVEYDLISASADPNTVYFVA